MDLSTTYMGLKLAHPFMPGASPLVGDLDWVRRLEDGGAAAIVMNSLFEEQLSGGKPEAGENVEFNVSPDEYLEQIRKIKAAVKVPVIGSLNGSTVGGWLHYARLIEQAGADGLELNVYAVAADPNQSGTNIELMTLEMVGSLKRALKIPVAVKLSPYYTSLAHFANQLQMFGTDGLVVFNRFYQSDIDPVTRQVINTIQYSESSELLLRLRWLAILSGRVTKSLAVSGGVHTGEDAVKAIMAGAAAVQVVSALLDKGPEHLGVLKIEMQTWMEENKFESVGQMQGCMNLSQCADPKQYERANYLQNLASW